METFSALLAFVWGIHRSPVNSSHKGQWRWALMFSLISVWINSWINNREAGDLRRYRAHYDVIVMNGQVRSPYRCGTRLKSQDYLILKACSVTSLPPLKCPAPSSSSDSISCNDSYTTTCSHKATFVAIICITNALANNATPRVRLIRIWQNTVWCRYNAVNFPPNLRKRHPTPRPSGRVMRCFYVPQFWFLFCFSLCSDVCNIM